MDREKWNQLVTKLLSIGGTRVVEVFEEDLDKLLERGAIIQGKPRLVKRRMRPCRCHQNSVLYYENYQVIKPDLRIVTGWSLSNDGLWRQHTWLKDNKEIVETTVKRQVYFGIVLEGQELEDFCFVNQ